MAIVKLFFLFILRAITVVLIAKYTSMRIVAMKRKIIVALISFATAATFNGVMQAGYLPDQFGADSGLPIHIHTNCAIIRMGKSNTNSSELISPIGRPETNRKEGNKNISANKNR